MKEKSPPTVRTVHGQRLPIDPLMPESDASQTGPHTQDESTDPSSAHPSPIRHYREETEARLIAANKAARRPENDPTGHDPAS